MFDTDKSSLLKKANELPLKPGVYMMKDAAGTVIYVGKAKNLKNRVTSYFRNVEHNAKTEKMISLVDDFDVIITASELDALLTECSLIKRFSPTYNIALKHGRGYPFICLTEKNGFPVLKLETFRTAKGQYWGPYISRRKSAVFIETVKKMFRFPKCSENAKRKKVCLEYHLGHCPGYCEGLVSREELDGLEQNVADVFNGNIDALRQTLTKKMERYAENLDFERAAAERDRLRSLDYIAERQTTKAPPHRNADYIGYAEQNGITCVYTLCVKNGYIVAEHCDVFREPFRDDLLSEYIGRFYEDGQTTGIVYIDKEYDWVPLVNEWLKGAVRVPSFDKDAEMLEMCHRNASEQLLQHLGRTQRAQRALAQFCDFTGIRNASRMELYDVSHLAGSDVVCGMITCVDGALNHDLYRKFKIGKFDGRDDTAYMSEAVTRRLQRYKDGDEKFSPLPNVIVCDGALGQIHAVDRVVAQFGYPILVIGFKKDSHHRTKSVVFAGGHEKILNVSPEVFSFCGRLQESVHKYAISFHRSLRDNSAAKSELLKIEGLGKVKVKALYDSFKTIDAMRAASKEGLMRVKGISEALALKIKNTL